MSVPETWRRIDSPPADGPTNMAVDQVLLDTVGQPNARPVWRTYTWSEPTLSLGYFQRVADVPDHLSGLPHVRRQTGGGAILHDRELTYSLSLPTEHPLALVPTTDLYDRVHRCIADVLGELGVTAVPRGDCAEPVGGVAAQRGPYLCFVRCCAQDLAIDGVKVVGSAQRRHPKAVLQHGSVLLAASDHEPALPGIRELTGQALQADALARALADRVAEQFDVTWDATPLQSPEWERVEACRSATYAAASWNDRR